MAHALETGTRRMRTLSWADFDRALDSAVARLASSSLSGVYGVPRGGLVLAVCLSHRLGIPLLEKPQAVTWVFAQALHCVQPIRY